MDVNVNINDVISKLDVRNDRMHAFSNSANFHNEWLLVMVTCDIIIAFSSLLGEPFGKVSDVLKTFQSQINALSLWID